MTALKWTHVTQQLVPSFPYSCQSCARTLLFSCLSSLLSTDGMQFPASIHSSRSPFLLLPVPLLLYSHYSHAHLHLTAGASQTHAHTHSLTSHCRLLRNTIHSCPLFLVSVSIVTSMSTCQKIAVQHAILVSGPEIRFR